MKGSEKPKKLAKKAPQKTLKEKRNEKRAAPPRRTSSRERPTEGWPMSTIGEILQEKTGDVIRIDGGATVFEAVKAMVEANVGALLITEAPANESGEGESGSGEITGIFTERDYLRRIAVEGSRSRDTIVSDVMSSPVLVVTPETTVEQAMALMTDRRIRHAPVVDGSALVGMISIGDLVKFTSQKQSYQIQYLTEYISAPLRAAACAAA